MKILYLTFYFKPDLCAGSFRNSPLAESLKSKLGKDSSIELITTVPNRYQNYTAEAPVFEEIDGMTIHRILIPQHKSGFIDQIKSFFVFFFQTLKITRGKQYDLVFASSSRLFTAFLGKVISQRKDSKLYLDIRDIFTDTMKDVLKSKMIKTFLIPVLTMIESYTFRNADHINLVSEGFKRYFHKYNRPKYTFFTNGIDDEFLNLNIIEKNDNTNNVITYAGNIGEGQGLEKIIPKAAAKLPDFRFRIIGNGGRLKELTEQLEKHSVPNVELIQPVNRKELIEYYKNTGFLFLHLNDYPAFEKVLPSKIFEYATFNVPMIAGVSGYAAEFIKQNVSSHILFSPGDVNMMVNKINGYSFHKVDRSDFISKFSRSQIMNKMSDSILSYL